MKIILQTRDGSFVRDAEIPPFHPPPEVITWGARVFVHEHAHSERIHRSESPKTYIEALLYPLEVVDFHQVGHPRTVERVSKEDTKELTPAEVDKIVGGQ